MRKNKDVDFSKMKKVTKNVDYIDDRFHFYMSYKARVVTFIVMIILLLVGAYVLVTKSYNDFGIRKLGYNENGNASNYVVNVEPSEYYPDGVVDAGLAYIKDTIKSVESTFKYNIYLSNTADVRYEYDIVAKLLIYGENDYLLLDKDYPIIDKKNINLRNSNKLNLEEKVQIDYKYFLKLANDYFATNNVKGVAKVLVTMEVNSNINYPYFNDFVVKNSVVQMDIPLTSESNQIKITASNYNDDGRFERIVIGEPKNENLLYLGLVLFILAIVTIISFISFISRSTPKKSKYVSLRDALLKEYDQIIVNVKRVPSIEGKNVIDCYSFSELLDAQDTLKKPILFNEIVRNQKCMFIIVDDSNVFKYVLKEVDLEFK